jgi:hypothetical protein
MTTRITLANGNVPASGTITGANLEVTEGVTVAGDVQTSDSLMRESQVYLQSVIPSVLKSGHVYDLGVINSAQDLSGISFPAEAGYVQTCEIWMGTGDGATGYTVTWPVDSIWPDEAAGIAMETLAANTTYRFVVRQEPSGKLIINCAYYYSV